MPEESAQPARKVLIVDDDDAIIDILDRCFRMAKYSTILARRGEEALRKAQEERPDLICLDIMLPGLDGYSILMKLRGDPRTKDTPVFIVSGESVDIHRDISRTFGAVEFIGKPFDIKEILQKAANILESRD
jgi:twitching motility two-component system response regulator PilH